MNSTAMGDNIYNNQDSGMISGLNQIQNQVRTLRNQILNLAGTQILTRMDTLVLIRFQNSWVLINQLEFDNGWRLEYYSSISDLQIWKFSLYLSQNVYDFSLYW